jgi:hypothetical protein
MKRFSWALCAIALAIAACGDSDETQGEDEVQAKLSEARAFKQFELLWSGEEVAGLTLDSVSGPNTGPTSPDAVWSFAYGDCKEIELDDEADICNYVTAIDVESICRRFPGRSWKLSPFKGAITAWRKDDLEVYSGRTTAVIHAESRQQARELANALRPVSSSGPVERLQAPVPGSLDGGLPCQANRKK